MAHHHLRTIPQFTEEEQRRFWSHVRIGDPLECWPWTAYRNPKGYGGFKLGGRKGPYLLASRAAYFLYYGEDPGPDLVCHSCDYTSCCNPIHLFRGTSLDNLMDSIRKGRYRHAKTKLSQEAIQDIVENGRKYGQQIKLARKYGIDDSHVSRIARGDVRGVINSSLIITPR